MTIEGFCILGRADEPLGADKLCVEHRMVGIPPTYGKRTQTWVDGAWSPRIEKPVGYRYTPRFKDEPSTFIPEPLATPCGICGKTFSYRPSGGSAPLYCGSLCKGRAARERRREARKARVAS